MSDLTDGNIADNDVMNRCVKAGEMVNVKRIGSEQTDVITFNNSFTLNLSNQKNS